ncbi:inorganic diphosphatase [Geobacillus sp. CAMR12739]|nr:inorganic diphosphatase [Geobacillus sp. CAMR12739]
MAFENKIVEAFIEIPTGSQNKYEFDKERGIFKLDRVLYSPMFYPAEYGYLQNTLALDGDPLDILVITTNPTFPGCVIDTRVIGYLNMVDSGEEDAKLIGVPVEDPRFDEVRSIEDLPQHKLKEIAHFFERYKDLQGKRTEIGTWEGPEAAAKLIDECIARYNEQKTSNPSNISFHQTPFFYFRTILPMSFDMGAFLFQIPNIPAQKKRFHWYDFFFPH